MNWNPIQEGYIPPAPPTHGANYYWVAPANLPVGSDLTVRVVARDTSGNWGERVSVPYTVRDGTVPTVALTSPNGGEIWDMGSTHPITWTMSSGSPIAWIVIWFLYDNTGE